jgi:SAM-dependent methyltransferase
LKQSPQIPTITSPRKEKKLGLNQAYDFALSFDSELVAKILDRFQASRNSLVVDPFCGTGTTLVECKRRGIRYVGVDANPACVFVARGKLDWEVSSKGVHRELPRLRVLYNARVASFLKTQHRKRIQNENYGAQEHRLFRGSATGKYLRQSGMMKRGWISSRPALKTLFVVDLIRKHVPNYRTRRFFLLSLFGLMVPNISNMRYGPEIFRARRRHDVNVFGLFEERVRKNLKDLERLRSSRESFGKRRQINPRVYLGDSVNGGLNTLATNSVDFIITSPPYPSEHDYTRLTRLELVFGQHVTNNDELRAIKRRLIRCCTRNIYESDQNTRSIHRFRSIRKLIERIEKLSKGRKHGFSRLYARVVGEYFGGMYEHFKRSSDILRPGGRCAYVVGDQASFFSVQIKTAELLAHLATSKGLGFKVKDMVKLRSLRGTTGKRRHNYEWLLVLEKADGKTE